ncbi:MAG: S8 family serine peptidase [Bacteroidota bacterium]
MRTIRLSYCLLFCFFLLQTAPLIGQVDHVPGEILVKLRRGLTAEKWLLKSGDLPISAYGIKAGKMISAPMNIYSIQFDPQMVNDKQLLRQVRQNPAVEIAQFNHYVSLRSTVPNDPQYNQQWQYDNTGQSGGTAGADIDMDLAWDVTTGGLSAQGDTIVVCVIDDGIFANHPDIAPNLWINHAEIPNNGIDDDNNGFVDDVRGWDTGSSSDAVYDGGFHGTPVAGIVGAKGNNGTGVAGVNWDVKLMIVQGGTGVESEVLEAYSYPLVMRQKYNQTNGAEGAFVVATNASWGIDFGQPSNAPLWCAFYDTLGVHGILNAGATANAALDVDTQGDLPTGCTSDYLISVTNMNDTDQKVGQAAWGLMSVDLGAFGEGTHTVSGPNGYGGFGGTSGATPHVAGTIGLLYSSPCPSLIAMAKSNPGAAALMVKDAILDGVDPNTSLAGITVTGGRLNVHNSMQLLLQACGPCPPPNLEAPTGLTDVQVTLNWMPSDSALTSDLQWRPLGDSVWNTVNGVDSSYQLTGLTPCTEYEYQLLSFCANDTSEFYAEGTFKTDGCCENPADFALVSALQQAALFNWGSVLAAQSYQLQIREQGGSWTLVNTTDTSYIFSGLMPCTNYEVEISVICQNDTVDFGQRIDFRTRGCGPCIDGNYCAPPDLDTSEEWIAEIAVHTLNHISGSNGGYGDFTNANTLTTELTIGMPHGLSLTPGFLGFPYDEYFKVWIDYNQDGDFDDPDEEVFDAGTSSPNAVSGQFTVPMTALPGGTRMRIYMLFDAEPDPCSTPADAFGEVEDYCVSIVPVPVPCAAPVNVDTLSVSNTGLLIGWDRAMEDSAYVLRYREMGAASWMEENTTADSMLLEGLGNCQEYEVQIKTLCGAEESEFGEVDTFRTLCRTALESNFPAGSITVFPNPFSQELTLNLQLTDQPFPLRIELISPMGTVVSQQLVRSTASVVSVATDELAAGMYWLKVRDQQGRQFISPVVKMK